MTLMMRLVTSLTGRLVGKDAVGNVYYEAKRRAPAAAAPPPLGDVPRRGRGEQHPAGVACLAALHHGRADPETVRRAWQKPHEPNLTGTPLGYRPPGSDYLGGKRAPRRGDYEAWTPGS